MTRLFVLVMSLVLAGAGVTMAPVANAEMTVMYEVTSRELPTATIEYADIFGMHTLTDVPLPWRMNATVAVARSTDARVRATWPNATRYKWMTVRITWRGSQICEIFKDVEAEAACTGLGYYWDRETPR